MTSIASTVSSGRGSILSINASTSASLGSVALRDDSSRSSFIFPQVDLTKERDPPLNLEGKELKKWKKAEKKRVKKEKQLAKKRAKQEKKDAVRRASEGKKDAKRRSSEGKKDAKRRQSEAKKAEQLRKKEEKKQKKHYKKMGWKWPPEPPPPSPPPTPQPEPEEVIEPEPEIITGPVRKERRTLTEEVKDLTLMISGLFDEVQKRRKNVVDVEVKNTELTNQVKKEHEIYTTLRKDLHGINKDYRRADRDYKKGRKKVVVEKHYLRKNAKLQKKIIATNIDLLAEMTVVEEVIPNVCRWLRLERVNEQNRCVKQLRRRLAKKRRRLAELQKEIAEQEACSNQVCVMSERLQHEVEDKRLSQSQSVGVTHLRSVAYGLSRAQYQSDDVTREVEFCKEMNTSQYNAFNNELHWKVFLYREKTQVMQNLVARAFQPKTYLRGKPRAAMAHMANVARKEIPQQQKDWMKNQLQLSFTHKKLVALEYRNAMLEIEHRNARMYNKLVKLRRRVHFALEKRRQFLQDTTSCRTDITNIIYV